jgi:hypothetical protein
MLSVTATAGEVDICLIITQRSLYHSAACRELSSACRICSRSSARGRAGRMLSNVNSYHPNSVIFCGEIFPWDHIFSENIKTSWLWTVRYKYFSSRSLLRIFFIGNLGVIEINMWSTSLYLSNMTNISSRRCRIPAGESPCRGRMAAAGIPPTSVAWLRWRILSRRFGMACAWSWRRPHSEVASSVVWLPSSSVQMDHIGAVATSRRRIAWPVGCGSSRRRGYGGPADEAGEDATIDGGTRWCRSPRWRR